jgi:hypothetical protein
MEKNIKCHIKALLIVIVWPKMSVHCTSSINYIVLLFSLIASEQISNLNLNNFSLRCLSL